MSLSFTNIKTLVRNSTGTNSTSFTDEDIALYTNLGIDNLLLKVFGQGAGGSWQLDDSNQTDYPIITTNLVSGQRDYSFTTDGSGNLVLDIYKVMAKNSASGVFKELTPIDQQGEDATTTINDGQNATGVPTAYDKTGNGIFLDLIPSYNSTGGLKVFINRESTYFTSSDTTKKWGYTGLWHQYLILYASYEYARNKNLSNREAIKRDLKEVEDDIIRQLAQRQRDVKGKLIPRVEDNK